MLALNTIKLSITERQRPAWARQGQGSSGGGYKQSDICVSVTLVKSYCVFDEYTYSMYALLAAVVDV